MENLLCEMKSDELLSLGTLPQESHMQCFVCLQPVGLLLNRSLPEKKKTDYSPPKRIDDVHITFTHLFQYINFPIQISPQRKKCKK